MRWLVLFVILMGTFISSVGGMNSHGIAAIASVSHVTAVATDTAHDHAHRHVHSHAQEGGGTEWVMESLGASADHPHHGADHSHDKAHALPVTWHMAAPLLPEWIGQTRLWIEMVEASRLERPPMG